MKKYVLPILGIIVVFFIIFLVARYSFTYSEGNRAGRLIKFSKQGFMFRTYEGEMNLGGVSNAANGSMMMNYMWDFSVENDAVADTLLKLKAGIFAYIIKKNEQKFRGGATQNIL